MEGELGRGGMGVVFRARSPEGLDVAIKVLLDATSEEALASFEREKRLLWGLGLAEGFVPILDAGVEAGRPYFVMPLLTGGTLRARVRRGPLPAAEAVSLAIQLARAVGRAHDRGILHRDLKPENVIFTAEGAPLVADLGLAKHFRRDLLGASQSRSFSASGTIVGSPGYLSPEQVEDSKRLTPAADVFSLVVMLHECLAGDRPFNGRGLLEYQEALRSAPRPLREVAPAAPAWLERLCAKGLARNPAHRFEDGHALARALAAGPPRRSGRLVAIVAAGLILLVALGLVGLVHSPRGPGVAVPPGVAPVASGELRRRAFALVAAKDWGGAAVELTRVIEAEPGNAEAWSDRALARANLHDLAGAKADIAKALALAPRNAAVWSQRGLVRALEGDFAGAIEDQTKAVDLAPNVGTPYMQRGLARSKRGDLPGCEDDCRRALALDPLLAGAWAGVAYVQLQRSDLDGAVANATKALDLDPRLMDACLVRGLARVRRNDAAGAIADYDRLIALDPRSASAWSGRAEMHGTLGHWADAASDYGKAVELEPNAAVLWNGRGWYRAHAGDAEGAMADCLRALELAPRDAAIVHSLAWARAKKGDDVGAIADFTRAIALDPRLPDAPRDRGRARERTGDVKGAIADYELFLELAPDDPEAPEIRLRLAGLRH